MYTEKMNIYKQKASWFIVVFVCVMLAFFCVLTEDYWWGGFLIVLVLIMQIYITSLHFTIGHTQQALVFGLLKQQMIPFPLIEQISIENIDYMGRFGGYGYRRFRKRYAYVFNDSGFFLCVNTQGKHYFFSLVDEVYWTTWLSSQENLNSK